MPKGKRRFIRRKRSSSAPAVLCPRMPRKPPRELPLHESSASSRLATENPPSTSHQPPVTENTPSTSHQPPVTERTVPPRVISLQSRRTLPPRVISLQLWRTSPPRVISLQSWRELFLHESSDSGHGETSPSTSRQPQATERTLPPRVVSLQSRITLPPRVVSLQPQRELFLHESSDSSHRENSPSMSHQPPVTNSRSTSRSPSTVSPATPITIHKEGEGPLYLTLPQVAAPTPKAVLRARLLTSADAMAQVEEKEQKKRLALEEKERRKIKREEKKRQKEMEQKPKTEERLKKLEMKAKVSEVAKKQRVTKKTALRGSSSTSQESCSEPPRKKPRKEKHDAGAVTEIDTNVCCVCFGLYSEDVSGADWIECACGRWLHEECGKEYVVDAAGKERFCPTCL